MIISKVCKVTGLTKKAVEYYIERGLVNPEIDESGYREFSKMDIDTLRQVSVLRMLGVTVQEIKAILQSSQQVEELRRCVLKRQLEYKLQEQQIKLLERLAEGKTIYDIGQDIICLNETKSIKNKLLEAFPGYFGRLYLIHFGTFLEEPIHTEEQKEAFVVVVAFLDNIKVPERLKAYIEESQGDTDFWTDENIIAMEKQKKQGIDNIEQFIEDNTEFIQAYQEFKNSEIYASSFGGQFAEVLKDFFISSGYNDIFIPAMRKLSPSYEAYYKKLEKANEVFLEKYPEYK